MIGKNGCCFTEEYSGNKECISQNQLTQHNVTVVCQSSWIVRVLDLYDTKK